jgi:hypothetical protein
MDDLEIYPKNHPFPLQPGGASLQDNFQLVAESSFLVAHSRCTNSIPPKSYAKPLKYLFQLDKEVLQTCNDPGATPKWLHRGSLLCCIKHTL